MLSLTVLSIDGLCHNPVVIKTDEASPACLNCTQTDANCFETYLVRNGWDSVTALILSIYCKTTIWFSFHYSHAWASASDIPKMLQFNFLSRHLAPITDEQQIDSFCCRFFFFFLSFLHMCVYARVFVRARLRNHDGYPSLAMFVALLCPALSTPLPWLSQCL